MSCIKNSRKISNSKKVFFFFFFFNNSPHFQKIIINSLEIVIMCLSKIRNSRQKRDSKEFFINCLPSLISMCNAFPHLAEDVCEILYGSFSSFRFFSFLFFSFFFLSFFFFGDKINKIFHRY